MGRILVGLDLLPSWRGILWVPHRQTLIFINGWITKDDLHFRVQNRYVVDLVLSVIGKCDR